MIFCENLRRLRKQAGLSQEDVARRLFISRQSVSKWENGGAEPGIEHLKALAVLYGVTVDELVGSLPTALMEKAPETKPDHMEYRNLLTLRGIFVVIICAASMMLYNSVTLPFDFVAMLVGMWAPYPAVWICIMVLLILNMMVGALSLLTEGNVLAVLSIFICAICIGLLNRPGVKARFHIRKEEEQ